MKGNWYQ